MPVNVGRSIAKTPPATLRELPVVSDHSRFPDAALLSKMFTVAEVPEVSAVCTITRHSRPDAVAIATAPVPNAQSAERRATEGLPLSSYGATIPFWAMTYPLLRWSGSPGQG